MSEAKFELGRIVATPGALAALERIGANALEYLRRHVTGDWGHLCKEDKEANERALVDGSRILSAYVLPDGEKLWIITDATVGECGTRLSTTLLRPGEY